MNFTYLSFLLTAIAAGTAGVVNEADEFAREDPYGLMMALLGMGIVFGVLYLLYIIFSVTPKLYSQSFKTKISKVFIRKAKKPHITEQEKPVPTHLSGLTGEVNAAIAAAIHLYRSEMHDYEDTILTIKKVSRTYSPWSSKIYGLRQYKP